MKKFLMGYVVGGAMMFITLYFGFWPKETHVYYHYAYGNMKIGKCHDCSRAIRNGWQELK